MISAFKEEKRPVNQRDAEGRPFRPSNRALSRLPLRRRLPALLLLALILGGCAGTRLDTSHPLVTRAAAEPAAKVYFIRPFTDRYLGFADNKVSIEAGSARLMQLVKGEYTLATLKPGTVRLTVRNDTNHGPEFHHKEMARSKEFTFEAGQTYFLVLTPFDGEFRGVHFEMKTVDLPQAQELARYLRVAGPARSAPISRL
jgi:hypothetical protein